MTLRICAIDEIGSDEQSTIASWLDRLGHEYEWDDPSRPQHLRFEFARRLPWLGLPFVWAGSHHNLRRLLSSLDGPTVKVLRNCAYFWILTDANDFSHPALPNDRFVLIDWNASGTLPVKSSLDRLRAFPDLLGLSWQTDLLRKQISRISTGKTGPGSSVLILGPSGSGKEVVTRCLSVAAASGPSSSTMDRGSLKAVSGAWLNMEPGMAMTELVGMDRGPTDERIPGLLTQSADATLFIDDFESSSRVVQETLLRIMSVPEGEPATFRAVGGSKDKKTNAWLLFATNKDLNVFLNEDGLRSDFLYRFGSRVLWITPLRERPADFPAIAHAIWRTAWKDAIEAKNGEDMPKEEVLRSDALRYLLAKDLAWDGNVRSLVALVKMVHARLLDAEYNGVSQSSLFDMFVSRGGSFLDWLTEGRPRANATPADVQGRIRGGDDDDPARNAGGDTSTLLVPSEEAVRAVLTPEGWDILSDVVENAPRPRRGLRLRVRLARILLFAAARPSITFAEAALLFDAVNPRKILTTVRKDVRLMAGGKCQLLLKESSNAKGFRRNPEYFRVGEAPQ